MKDSKQNSIQSEETPEEGINESFQSGGIEFPRTKVENKHKRDTLQDSNHD